MLVSKRSRVTDADPAGACAIMMLMVLVGRAG
jgi:hypothetical protein